MKKDAFAQASAGACVYDAIKEKAKRETEAFQKELDAKERKQDLKLRKKQNACVMQRNAPLSVLPAIILLRLQEGNSTKRRVGIMGRLLTDTTRTTLARIATALCKLTEKRRLIPIYGNA